ncbi:MAG: DUF3617 family protein [Pseudomonadota bacterium]
MSVLPAGGTLNHDGSGEDVSAPGPGQGPLGNAMKYLAFLASALATITVPGTALADGLPMAPGLWKSTSTVTVSINSVEPAALAAQPETRISEACIPQSAKVLDARRLAGPGCEPSDVTRSGDDMSFVLVCQRADITLYGSMTASALAEGTQTHAQMVLTGRNADGNEMQIQADMVSERLGPCRNETPLP